MGKNKNGINGLNVMNGILSSVMRLIDKRMIISDQLLMLCWIYYNVIDNNNNYNKNTTNISKNEFLM